MASFPSPPKADGVERTTRRRRRRRCLGEHQITKEDPGEAVGAGAAAPTAPAASLRAEGVTIRGADEEEEEEEKERIEGKEA